MGKPFAAGTVKETYLSVPDLEEKRITALKYQQTALGLLPEQFQSLLSLGIPLAETDTCKEREQTCHHNHTQCHQ
jgi:hypothetical protein